MVFAAVVANARACFPCEGMQVSIAIRELHPRRAFVIARARRHAVRNVFLRIERDGITGYGEASPNAFYDETAEGVAAKLEAAKDFISRLEVRNPSDIGRAWEEAWALLQPSRAAQCALDLALWDWLGKREGRTVVELAWDQAPKPVTTFCTIGLSTPEELVAKLGELSGFPWIKIKSDRIADLAPIRTVRERAVEATLAVDANCAWGEHSIEKLALELAQMGVRFIEQPFLPADDARLLPASFALPIFADESCVTENDVERVAQHFDGFNIKLVKCGGLTPALRMARRGRELGRMRMVGCMLESSLLIAAGAVVAQRTDFADLDGAWLLADDPCHGLAFHRGRLLPSDAPGLGVEPEKALFAR